MTFYIYMLGVVDSIITSSRLAILLSGVTLIVINLKIWIEDLPKNTKYNGLIIILALSVFLAIFTPNSKTLAAMYLLPKLVESEAVQKIPDKALKVLNLKLDEWVKDLSDNNDK